MISIKKNKIQKPNILNNEWISEKLKAIKDTGNPGKKIDSRYKDDEVRNALKKLYHNKCAYCEGKVKPAQNQPNIDHYRPKDKIKSVENHKGYYWLGYEWTNLLHTCTNCNIIKSNQFPLKDESKRISDDLEKEGFFNNGEFVFENFKIENLTKEERLLLNPEIDEVEKHFYFLPNGEIKHLTKEGEETLNVCQLNRIELSKARQEITDEIIRKIIDIFVNYSQQSHYDMLTQLWRDKITYNQATEYSRFRYFIAHFFNYFIVDKLVEIGLTEYAIIVEQHFNEFKTTSK